MHNFLKKLRLQTINLQICSLQIYLDHVFYKSVLYSQIYLGRIFSSLFQNFWKYIFKDTSFLKLSNRSSFSVQDKEASSKSNDLSFTTLLCINKVLLQFLNSSIALLIGLVMSLLLLSTTYVFSFIPTFFVACLKNYLSCQLFCFVISYFPKMQAFKKIICIVLFVQSTAVIVFVFLYFIKDS